LILNACVPETVLLCWLNFAAAAAAAAVCHQPEEEPIVAGIRYMDPKQEAAAAERGAHTAATQAQQQMRHAHWAVWHRLQM
jgi:hypothetical protein